MVVAEKISKLSRKNFDARPRLLDVSDLLPSQLENLLRL